MTAPKRPREGGPKRPREGGPPKLAERLLRASAPPADRRFLADDLREEFTARASREGPAAVRRWYWRQALQSAPPLVRRRIEARLRRLGAVRPSIVPAIDDARQGARWIVRNPWLAAVVVLTLGIAFAAALAGFSVVHAIVLRPLPFTNPDRLVMIHMTGPTRARAIRASSLQDVDDWRVQSRSFDAISAHTPQAYRLTGRGEPREVDGQRVGRDFERVVGVRVMLGRPFEEGDFAGGGTSRVALLTHAFWRREFGGDPSVVGTTLQLDEEPYRIVGVLPAIDVSYPGDDALWVPLVARPGAFWESSRGTGWVTAVGRLKAGVGVDAAAAELSAVAAQLARTYPKSNADKTIAQLQRVRDELLGPLATALGLLAAALAAVVLIAFGNIGNLLLAAASERRPEFAVRAALGAGRLRLARQLIAEALLLSVFAALIGLVAAPPLVEVFLAVYPSPLPRAATGSYGLALIGAAGVLVFAATLAVAVPQIVRATRPDARPDAGADRTTTSRGDRAAGYLLIAAQVALSLMLVVSGSALVRTMGRLASVDTGFRPDGVLTFLAKPSPQRFRSATDAHGFYESAIDAIRQIPGVRAAATGTVTPLTSRAWSFGIRPPGAQTDVLVAVNIVSPDYASALGVRLLAGRLLTAIEQKSGVDVALINASLARVLAPTGESVVGSRMNYSGRSWEIVGVLDDVRHDGPRRPATPELFIPWHMAGKSVQAFIVRADGNPLQLLPQIAERIRAIDPTAPITDVATLDDRLQRAVAAERFRATLLAALACIAVILAALGTYSVTAYAVARRTREYGIRLALGERPASIRRRALWGALLPAITGLCAGCAASLASASLLDAFLYDVSARDPRAVAAGCSALLAMAALAAATAARKAAHLDPVTALRAR